MCCRCWRCCMPPSISPCFSSFFPPTPSIQPPLWAHTLFQPPSSIQTEIQPHQTSVLMSEGHKGIYFYSSLEPLPPEHLTWFHTSSHLQSPTETQSSCLSSIIQTNVMSDYLPPFICIQFLPVLSELLFMSGTGTLFSWCTVCLRCTGTHRHLTENSESGSSNFRYALIFFHSANVTKIRFSEWFSWYDTEQGKS